MKFTEGCTKSNIKDESIWNQLAAPATFWRSVVPDTEGPVHSLSEAGGIGLLLWMANKWIFDLIQLIDD